MEEMEKEKEREGERKVRSTHKASGDQGEAGVDGQVVVRRLVVLVVRPPRKPHIRHHLQSLHIHTHTHMHAWMHINIQSNSDT